jgi:hypothetical protein
VRRPEVLVIEDDEEFECLIREILGVYFIPVVDVVGWVSVLRASIDNKFYRDIPPKVITVDNDIVGGSVETSGIIPRIRKQYPDIKLIGLSCCPLKGMDVDLTKDRLAELPSTILRLGV